MTRSHKAEQMIFILFTELLNHALIEFRIQAFKLSLLSPDWNFIPGPVIIQQRCNVNVFREEIRNHLVGGFLAERDCTLSDHCLHPEEHCVDVFHSSDPSSAPNRNASCGVHPHMSIELPSQPRRNTLCKPSICDVCTHQTIILRIAGTERNHGLSFAVRTHGTVTQHQRTTRNTLPGSNIASMIRVAPGFPNV